ncbi:MAG: hypothetical protein ACUVTH_06605 [Thermogutta sp.]
MRNEHAIKDRRHVFFKIVIGLSRAVVFLALGINGWTAFASDDADEQVVFAVIRGDSQAENLLAENAWRKYEQGFEPLNGALVCDNKTEPGRRSGAVQSIELKQKEPRPLVAIAESAAEGVDGARDNDYSLYIDIEYIDGTPLWGQTAPFDVGTHDWQERRVVIFPEKPIRRLSYYLLFRNHRGKVLFRNPRLYQLSTAAAALFDGVPCTGTAPQTSGLILRDVARNTDFVTLRRSALGIDCTWTVTAQKGAQFHDVVLRSQTDEDRALTVAFLQPQKRTDLDGKPIYWLGNLRVSEAVSATREYANAVRTSAGATQRIARWPFAAVSDDSTGYGVGIDLLHPAVFRVGYNAPFEQLFIAYDIALTKEKPEARLRFVTFTFGGDTSGRAALKRYIELFPEYFAARISKHGQWMPFAKISQVQGWEDFGFRFKEGNNETEWDDMHDILTFRYTEPMTWWMPMATDLPRTYEAAVAEAERLVQQGKPQAKAWLSSSFRDEAGRIPLRLLDTPWCNGAVWSMNSLPQIRGEITDFSGKWNPSIREALYGPNRKGELDGEYIDSSEGYVTDELDFRRDHFVGSCPLTFDSAQYRPAVFRGLIVFEYVRAIAEDVHNMGKYMMANGTPGKLCWLAPLLDVMGTETNWNPNGRWQPMSDEELLFRRALCGKKPFCFLMNTDFDRFNPELVEKYMKRSLAYGMFPGFFSPNASGGHYFSRPELYNRDRPLFKKYVPLCRRLSEAGWEPITRARCNLPRVYVERFGNRYFTVFNDTLREVTAEITFDNDIRLANHIRDLVGDRLLPVSEGKVVINLRAEDVALLEIAATRDANP